MSRGGGDCDDVGSTDRTGDPDRRRFLRQIDSLERACSAGSDVREMDPRLKNDLRILTGIERHGRNHAGRCLAGKQALGLVGGVGRVNVSDEADIGVGIGD